MHSNIEKNDKIIEVFSLLRSWVVIPNDTTNAFVTPCAITPTLRVYRRKSANVTECLPNLQYFTSSVNISACIFISNCSCLTMNDNSSDDFFCFVSGERSLAAEVTCLAFDLVHISLQNASNSSKSKLYSS